MPDHNNELINSVGIELEFSNIDRNNRELVSKLHHIDNSFRLLHDASCETPSVLLFNNYTIDPSVKFPSFFRPFLSSSVLGGEIVSGILDSMDSKYIDSLTGICNLLKESGESEYSSRDSLHVHVNVSRQFPHYALKNIIALSCNYEYILFKLGGMGSENRGITNNFAYQRPLTGKGFPVISYRDGFVYSGFTDYLLQSKNRKEFYTILNESFYGYSNQIRYVPQRYTSVNLYSSLYHGSIEFRTANKTLNPMYITAWVELCRSIIEKAFKSYEVTYNPLPLSDCYGLSKQVFVNMMEDLNLSKSTMLSLEYIWDTSEDLVYKDVPMFTHLSNSYNKFTRDTPAQFIKYVEDSSEIISSDVSTVHNIGKPRIDSFITKESSEYFEDTLAVTNKQAFDFYVGKLTNRDKINIIRDQEALVSQISDADFEDYMISYLDDYETIDDFYVRINEENDFTTIETSAPFHFGHTVGRMNVYDICRVEVMEEYVNDNDDEISFPTLWLTKISSHHRRMGSTQDYIFYLCYIPYEDIYYKILFPATGGIETLSLRDLINLICNFLDIYPTSY